MFELKEDLKKRAAEIRVKRKMVKAQQRANAPTDQWKLQEMRQDYRYRHVAYSLARGRTRDQIENKVREGNELDEKLLQMYVDAIQHHNQILTGSLPKSPPDPDKLYVVVDDLLPKVYAGVQASHALAEYLRKNPASPWSNGTLVVLKADMCRIHRYEQMGWVAFREPDLGGRLTAVAAFKPRQLPSDLSLL